MNEISLTDDALAKLLEHWNPVEMDPVPTGGAIVWVRDDGAMCRGSLRDYKAARDHALMWRWVDDPGRRSRHEQDHV